MKLIDNAGQWHRLWSVRFAILGVVLNAGVTGWVLFQGVVSPLLYASVNMALGVAVGVSRVVSQQPKDEAQP